MKPLASLALGLLLAGASPAGPRPIGPAAAAAASPSAPAARTPHPAVVRVIAPLKDGTALGSGTLVAVNQHCGLVVTNWHVVRDAAGQIEVRFPDGFRSGATVLQTDRDWDLAALVIWRPTAEPVPLATAAPQRGELLAIAGYGAGTYRAAAGRCVQYVAPGEGMPFEMVELSAGARQGDSGGPIFNARGELAGVLFGAARGETTGSFCGRVRVFLAPLVEDFRRADVLLAEQSPPGAPPAASPAPLPAATPVSTFEAYPVAVNVARPRPNAGQAAMASGSPVAAKASGSSLPSASRTQPVVSAVPGSVPPAAAPSGSLPVVEPNEISGLEPIKNVLAVVGAVAIVLFAAKVLGNSAKA